MAKKSKKTIRRQPSITVVEKDVKVSKQAVGGVTGAVLGGMVAGPIGAIAGGFAGAVVGEQSARGRKPVKKTADAIRSEIREAKPLEKLKSMATATKSYIESKTKKSTKGRAKKKSKSGSAKKSAKKAKAKSSAKGAKTKKRAKKKR
jgi:hypothetical protein